MDSPRVRTALSAPLRDDRGFALAIAVFALVVLAAVVAGGYFSASQEYHIGRGMKSVMTSFYAGEAGIERVLDTWNPATVNDLSPGDTLTFGPVVMEGGGSYSALLVRVDAGLDPLLRYYYLETAGRPPGIAQGERRQAAMARVRFHDEICCEAGVKVLNSVNLGGANPLISGYDTIPSDWPASDCVGFPRDSLPGAILASGGTVTGDPGEIEGQPNPYETDATLDASNLFVFEDLDFDAIAARADHVFTGETYKSGSDLAPSIDANGECDRSDPNNWGAPEDPAHPCFDYFPIIHVKGGAGANLNLSGPGVAQAILVVDDNLNLSGPFNLYGIVLTKDDLEVSGKAYLWGAAFVIEDVELSGNSPTLFLSHCVAARAVRYSSLARGRLMQPRAWVELF